MRRWPGLAIGLLLLSALTGCTSGFGDGGPHLPDPTGAAESAAPDAAEAAEPDAAEAAEAAAAQERAQAWLDAALLPPGAVNSSRPPADFNSYYVWPCTPVTQIEAFWTVPDVSVAETANWLTQHPTADLIVPQQLHLPEGAGVDGVNVGQVPAHEAQEGIVYSVTQTREGVAVRAQIAAMHESATCPSLPPGTSLGGVGQG